MRALLDTDVILDSIITRNQEDYRGATLPVYSPTDFLAQLSR